MEVGSIGNSPFPHEALRPEPRGSKVMVAPGREMHDRHQVQGLGFRV